MDKITRVFIINNINETNNNNIILKIFLLIKFK